MLKLSLMEFLLRTTPESFLLIFAAYLIDFKTIEKKRFILSSLLLAVSTYLLRLLPIHYGINTLINIPIYIFLCVSINKISIIKAVPTSLIVPIILAICEELDVLIVKCFLNGDITRIMDNKILKLAYMTPSMILFAIVMVIFYLTIYRSKKNIDKHTYARENIK
ncbi:MAG: hypothetical protein Q8936_12875 [Bacillota bacterium]|nr:hypothetical protein [Bacillota bacterium]